MAHRGASTGHVSSRSASPQVLYRALNAPSTARGLSFSSAAHPVPAYAGSAFPSAADDIDALTAKMERYVQTRPRRHHYDHGNPLYHADALTSAYSPYRTDDDGRRRERDFTHDRASARFDRSVALDEVENVLQRTSWLVEPQPPLSTLWGTSPSKLHRSPQKQRRHRSGGRPHAEGEEVPSSKAAFARAASATTHTAQGLMNTPRTARAPVLQNAYSSRQAGATSAGPSSLPRQVSPMRVPEAASVMTATPRYSAAASELQPYLSPIAAASRGGAAMAVAADGTPLRYVSPSRRDGAVAAVPLQVGMDYPSQMLAIPSWAAGEAALLDPATLHYLEGLESELRLVTSQHSKTCELLCSMTFAKDCAELCWAEEVARRAACEAEHDAYQQLLWSYARLTAAHRDTAWREKLNDARVRVAVAEEAVSMLRQQNTQQQQQQREQQTHTQLPAASSPTVKAEDDSQQVVQRIMATLQPVLTQEHQRLQQLVEAVPERVCQAFTTSPSPRPSSLSPPIEVGAGGPNGAPPQCSPSLTGSPAHSPSTTAVVAVLPASALPAAGQAANASSCGVGRSVEAPAASTVRVEQRSVSTQTTSEAGAAAGQPPESSQTSAAVTRQVNQFVQHYVNASDAALSLYLESLDEKTLFAEYELELVRLVQEKQCTLTWASRYADQKEELKQTRERVLSLQTQLQVTRNAMAGGAARSTSAHANGGAATSTRLDGSMTSVTGASTASSAMYDQYSIPYIPPKLKETAIPPKRSMDELRKEAARLGARPAAHTLLPPPPPPPITMHSTTAAGAGGGGGHALGSPLLTNTSVPTNALTVGGGRWNSPSTESTASLAPVNSGAFGPAGTPPRTRDNGAAGGCGGAADPSAAVGGLANGTGLSPPDEREVDDKSPSPEATEVESIVAPAGGSGGGKVQDQKEMRYANRDGFLEGPVPNSDQPSISAHKGTQVRGADRSAQASLPAVPSQSVTSAVAGSKRAASPVTAVVPSAAVMTPHDTAAVAGGGAAPVDTPLTLPQKMQVKAFRARRSSSSSSSSSSGSASGASPSRPGGTRPATRDAISEDGVGRSNATSGAAVGLKVKPVVFRRSPSTSTSGSRSSSTSTSSVSLRGGRQRGTRKETEATKKSAHKASPSDRSGSAKRSEKGNAKKTATQSSRRLARSSSESSSSSSTTTSSSSSDDRRASPSRPSSRSPRRRGHHHHHHQRQKEKQRNQRQHSPHSGGTTSSSSDKPSSQIPAAASIVNSTATGGAAASTKSVLSFAFGNKKTPATSSSAAGAGGGADTTSHGGVRKSLAQISLSGSMSNTVTNAGQSKLGGKADTQRSAAAVEPLKEDKKPSAKASVVATAAAGRHADIEEDADTSDLTLTTSSDSASERKAASLKVAQKSGVGSSAKGAKTSSGKGAASKAASAVEVPTDTATKSVAQFTAAVTALARRSSFDDDD